LAGGIWDVKNSNHGLWLVKLMENQHYFEKKKIDAKIDRYMEQNKFNCNPEIYFNYFNWLNFKFF